MYNFEDIKTNNNKNLLLKITLAIFLILATAITLIATITSVTAKADSVPYYTYTFKYLEEYYFENGREYYGNNVIINATNDIINKNNDGWALNDIIVDKSREGSFVTNYNEFSNKYYLVWKEEKVRVYPGRKPNLDSLRTNFNCFYNIFKFWRANGNVVYQTKNLPQATKNMEFTAEYAIKQKIKLQADDQALLNYYPNEYAEIELTQNVINNKTVYEYTFDYRAMYENTEDHYKYLLIKNGEEVPYIGGVPWLGNRIKISPININKNDLVFTLESNFKDQNQFNEERTKYTGKRYKGSFILSMEDTWSSLVGYGGILDSTAKSISSAGTLASGVSNIMATGIEGLADTVWIFADLASNIKVTLVYIITIFIACLITILIISLVFWVIRKVTKLAKKGVNGSV